MSSERFPTDKCIDIERLTMINHSRDVMNFIRKELDRLGGYIPLTPILLHPNAQYRYLCINEIDKQEKGLDGRRRAPIMYKLRFISDHSGKPVVPGTVYKYKMGVMEKNPRTGKDWTTREIISYQRQGFSRDIMAEATIDKDGCITVPREDACSLLNRFGKGITLAKQNNWAGHNHILEEIPPWESLDAEAPVYEEPVVAKTETKEEDPFADFTKDFEPITELTAPKRRGRQKKEL